MQHGTSSATERVSRDRARGGDRVSGRFSDLRRGRACALVLVPALVHDSAGLGVADRVRVTQTQTRTRTRSRTPDSDPDPDPFPDNSTVRSLRSFGSAKETRAALHVAGDWGYASNELLSTLDEELDIVCAITWVLAHRR